MKNLVFTLIFIISASVLNAQELHKMNRSEIKAEKKALQIEKINILLNNKSFVFDAMQVIMKDKSQADLSHYYYVKIENEKITSFLPYYSAVFENEIEMQNSPFNFIQSINNYELKKENGNTFLKVETSNDQTFVVFTFQICKLGHTLLKVTSTDRNCISFKGIIKETEEFQAVN